MNEAPGPIDPTSTQTIAGLYTESFRPAGEPTGIAVLTHGYADHCGRYHEVANVVVKAGWALLAYDCRGHGQSPGQRGYIDRFSTYLADFTAMQAAARRQFGAGLPMVLLGHSHGSLITLRALAGDQPPKVAAAIVSSPFLGLKLAVPGWRRLLGRVASLIAPRLSQPNSLRAEDLTRDVQKQAEQRADPLCFHVATARWFTEATAAQAYVLAHASRITVPTTWLVGHDDPIADPERSQAVAAKVPGARYHDLPGMKHEVFNEIDRGKVFSELTSALARAAPATSK